MKIKLFAVGVLLIADLIGCAGNRQQTDADGSYAATASIYSVMDSTALVYTDVAAGSPLNDNVWRWAGFLLHPVGQLLDYGFNRPVYGIAATMTYLFGYTAEDAMLDSQRRHSAQY